MTKRSSSRALWSKFRWTLFLLFLAAFSFYFAKAANLFFKQSKYVYYPVRNWVTTPDSFSGLAYEDVHFRSGDGLELSGWYFKAENPAGTILICHGNAGNISHRLEEVGVYRALGFNIFIFDYRGYGKSAAVQPTETGTYLDAEAAWRYLAEEKHVDPSRLVICGRSLGAAIACDLAVRHAPAALILESGFTSLADLGSDMYPYFPVRWLVKYRYDSAKKLPKVQCPVLVIHSRGDTIVPFHHGQTLFRVAHEPKEFLEITGPHNEGYAISEETYRKGLKKFLEGLNQK